MADAIEARHLSCHWVGDFHWTPANAEWCPTEDSEHIILPYTGNAYVTVEIRFFRSATAYSFVQRLVRPVTRNEPPLDPRSFTASGGCGTIEVKDKGWSMLTLAHLLYMTMVAPAVSNMIKDLFTNDANFAADMERIHPGINARAQDPASVLTYNDLFSAWDRLQSIDILQHTADTYTVTVEFANSALAAAT